jgi:hypothetical protein
MSGPPHVSWVPHPKNKPLISSSRTLLRLSLTFLSHTIPLITQFSTVTSQHNIWLSPGSDWDEYSPTQSDAGRLIAVCKNLHLSQIDAKNTNRIFVFKPGKLLPLSEWPRDWASQSSFVRNGEILYPIPVPEAPCWYTSLPTRIVRHVTSYFPAIAFCQTTSSSTLTNQAPPHFRPLQCLSLCVNSCVICGARRDHQTNQPLHPSVLDCPDQKALHSYFREVGTVITFSFTVNSRLCHEDTLNIL